MEIVLVNSMSDNMSSDAFCFEQFFLDFETRGVSGIDIPVLTIGINPSK